MRSKRWPWWCGAALVAMLLLWLGLTATHAGMQPIQTTPAEGGRPPIVLTPGPSRAAPPPLPMSPADERTALMAALLRFVLDDYLGDGRSGHENGPDLYAAQVDYYQRGRIDRAQVMADKRSYYRRWPERTYSYVPASLRIERAASDGVTIVFRHRYEVAAGRERRQGVAITRLEIVLRGGRFIIAREAGAVETRG
jgi:hypothetical protein